MKKTVTQFIKGSTVAVAGFGLALTAFAGTWSAPTGTPPNNNVDAPINVGATTQSKNGALGVTGFANFGVSDLLKKVSIGCIQTQMTGCLGTFGPILEVGYGTSSFDYDVTMKGKLLFPNNASKIGVGLTYPDRQLHVHSTNNQAGITISTGTTNWMSLYQPYNAGELRIRQGTVASGSDLVTFKANGNVGIGTTNPGKKLEVYGSALIGGEGVAIKGSASHGIVYLGDTNHYIRSVSGGGLRLGTYGAQDALVIQEGTGNVGIGVASPQAKLHTAGGDTILDDTTYMQDAEITGVTTARGGIDSYGVLKITGIRNMSSNPSNSTVPVSISAADCGAAMGWKLYRTNDPRGGGCANKGIVGYLIPY